jgi:methionine-rich copper-binding protein CopC
MMPDRSQRFRQMLGPLVAAALGIAQAVTLPAGVVHAHAELVQTDLPGPALPYLPEQIRLVFSQDLDNGSSATLLDPSRAQVPGTSSAIDRPRLRHLILTLLTTTPGPYTLAWNSVSAEDGHEQSSFFGLMAGGQPLALSDPLPGPPTSGPGDLGVSLAVAPDEQGVHRWAATISGAPPETIRRVLFRFTPLGAELGTENLTAQLDAASGDFVLSEPIALAGPWRVEVGVRRDSVPDDVRVPFTFNATPALAVIQEGV